MFFIFLSISILGLFDLGNCVDFAVVKFNIGTSDAQGWLQLYQMKPGEPMLIVGRIWNLEPGRLLGFHVHETGDVSNNCDSTGPHFNPTKKSHGSPFDSKNKHFGDLGNIESDHFGVATIHLVDENLNLSGQNSIIGRSFVIHENEDDLGNGDNSESKKSGNAGARIKCGIIGKSLRTRNKTFYTPINFYPYNHYPPFLFKK